MIEARSFWELVARRAGATPDALFALDEAKRTLTCEEFRSAAERAAAFSSKVYFAVENQVPPWAGQLNRTGTSGLRRSWAIWAARRVL